MVCDAVGDDEPLPVLDAEIPHGGELLRPGGVQDLQHARGVVHLETKTIGDNPTSASRDAITSFLPHLNLLPIEVLDGGVVLLHEVAGHELDGEGGLAHPAGPQHHHLELAHLEAAATIKSWVPGRAREARTTTSRWQHATTLVRHRDRDGEILRLSSRVFLSFPWSSDVSPVSDSYFS